MTSHMMAHDGRHQLLVPKGSACSAFMGISPLRRASPAGQNNDSFTIHQSHRRDNTDLRGISAPAADVEC